jgi:hypothetical protein
MSTPEPKRAAKSGHESIATLPAWLIAATTGVLGAAAYGLIDWLAPTKAEWSMPARLALLITSGALLLFLVLGLLYLRIWLRSRTRIAFGLMWDSRRNPICSNCRGPIYPFRDHEFYCGPCRSTFAVYDQVIGDCTHWEVIALVRKHGLGAKLQPK